MHVASISQGFIKVCRKLNRNIAMDNFIKHYQPGINPSVFQSPPSKLTQHVNDTFMWKELVFDPSSCPSLGHFNFIYVMLCVGGTRLGRHTQLESELMFCRPALLPFCCLS